MLFNLTATGGGVVVVVVVDGTSSMTGRFVTTIMDGGVAIVGLTLGYDGRAVENEFVLTTKLDEVIKGGK